MSKKNKNANGNDREEFRTTRYPFQFPEVVSMDEIGYYPDDLLSDRISRLEAERNKLLETRHDPRHWEVELAYLHREKQLRSIRAERHEAHVRSQILKGNDEELTMSSTFGPISVQNKTQLFN